MWCVECVREEAMKMFSRMRRGLNRMRKEGKCIFASIVLAGVSGSVNVTDEP